MPAFGVGKERLGTDPGAWGCGPIPFLFLATGEKTIAGCGWGSHLGFSWMDPAEACFSLRRDGFCPEGDILGCLFISRGEEDRRAKVG